METLYHQTNKVVQETQHLFSQLERKPPNLDIQAVENEIETKINLINRNCERLDILCMKGPIFQRQNTKMRVDQLKYDSRHLTAALNSWRNQILRRQQEEAEREALLSQKFTPNDHVDIMIDHNLQYGNSLNNAIHGVDNLISHGSDILENLRSQRMTLKGAHKRLIDIGNTLGLSNTTMRLIEQRARQDGFVLAQVQGNLLVDDPIYIIVFTSYSLQTNLLQPSMMCSMDSFGSSQTGHRSSTLRRKICFWQFLEPITLSWMSTTNPSVSGKSSPLRSHRLDASLSMLH